MSAAGVVRTELSPREIGVRLLGPIYAEFLARLHASMRPHDPEVRRLFVARAGVRLRRMYHAWCEARGLEPASSEILWASRLLATKALYGVDDATFHRKLREEYRKRTVGEVAQSLARHAESVPDVGDVAGADIEALESLLSSGALPSLQSFLEEESRAARSYLTTALGGEASLLIDSGWHGTIQQLLDPLTEGELTSVYFARVQRREERRPAPRSLVGLIVESDEFDPTRPESAIIFHRHLIEAPLEPPIPSIERVSVNDRGEVTVPEADGADGIDENERSDQLYLGILDHLAACGATPLHRLQHEHVSAVNELAQRILFPTAADVAAMDMGSRSADFGKDDHFPVLHQEDAQREDDGPEDRIRRSLWPQGQAVLEFGELGAYPALKQLSDTSAHETYFHPWKKSAAGEASRTVAIVTRTKDRPVLLARAAESVARQSHRDYTWVVVNDGGDPRPVLDVIRRSRVPRSQITLINNAESVGMEAASNRGVTAVDSDYVVIHDDDDSWEPGFLSVTTGFLAADPTYLGVVTDTTYVSEEVMRDQVIVRSTRPYNEWLNAIQLTEMSASNLFAPIAFLYRRKAYEDVGGYPEDLPVLGDWHFNLKVLARGDIGVVKLALANYHHRDRAGQSVFSNSVIDRRSKHVEYDARVRNAFLRKAASTEDDLSALTLAGYTIKTLREEVRRNARDLQLLTGNKGKRGGVEPADVDMMWLAVQALARNDHSRRHHVNVLAKRTDPAAPVRWSDVRALAKTIRAVDVPPTPDFDEATYLQENPDVLEKVVDPESPFQSGWHHYVAEGRFESRRRPVRKGFRKL